MTNHWLTSGLIIVTICIWIVWDIYVSLQRKAGDTESEVIRTFAVRHPAFVWVVGGLMGHFFWHAAHPAIWWKTQLILPACGIVVIALDLWAKHPKIPSVVWFLVGLTMWHILWPQVPLG